MIATFTEFNLTDEIKEAITKAKAAHLSKTDSLDLHLNKQERFGSKALKQKNFGADAFMQLAIQVCVFMQLAIQVCVFMQLTRQQWLNWFERVCICALIHTQSDVSWYLNWQTFVSG